jgi:predicted permease
VKRLAFHLARAVVRAASRRVPPQRREAFLREWEGELSGVAATESAARLVLDSLGAFADAREIGTMARTGPGGSGGRWWEEGFANDVSLALRGMRRAPAFTVVAVTTLALGMGGSAALYTLLDRVVLDPLPYPQADRLVRLDNQVPGVGPSEVWSLSTAQWVHFTDHATTLESVGLYRGDGGNVVTAAGPQRVDAVAVTATIMDLLGARTVRGRVIDARDDTPSAPVVAVLSHAFWQQSLGGDPDVVGTTLTFNDRPIEVVGVMDEGVGLPGWPVQDAPDLWLPLRVDRNGPFWNSHVFPGIARLAPGATPDGAAREIESLTARLPEAFPNAYSQSFFDRYGFRTRVTPLKESVLGGLDRTLWILFAGVAVVLLIACTNVANLFGVRMEGRRHELGLRAALGAGRGALLRLVLAEGLTLSLLGAAAALVLASWALPVLTSMAPADLPRVHEVTAMGVRTVGFTLLLSLLVGCALAAYPALGRGLSAARLAHSGRAVTGSRRRGRARGAMVVTQVALALTLVVGSGLVLASLGRLRSADSGIDPAGVLAVDLYLSYDRHPGDVAVWNSYRDILDRVRAIPGVTSAGMSEEVPVSGGYGCVVQGFEDTTVYDDLKDRGLTTCAGQEATSPGFFEALGIPVIQGRGLTDQDNDDPGRGAVVVSRAFADRFWPGRDPLGQGVAPNGNTEGPFYHVVGVVDDVARATTDGEVPLSQPAIAVYYPIRHNPEAAWSRNWWPGNVTLVVKADVSDPASLFPSIRRAVAEVDPQIPLANPTDMDAVVAAATSELAFVSLLLAIAAATALLLAAVGLYGVLSHVVAGRTREIGMRIAVGARPSEVRRMVVGETMALVGVGVVLGLALALAATRVMGSVWVGVEPSDPRVYGLAASVLAAVALAASWLPARRAARIDPLEALRGE